jgi:hypothetical protein
MSDLTVLPRTHGIAHRVPSAPIAEWKVRNADQLPSNLKRRLDSLPPYLSTKRAMEESGEGRSKLYEAAAAGRGHSCLPPLRLSIGLLPTYVGGRNRPAGV